MKCSCLCDAEANVLLFKCFSVTHLFYGVSFRDIIHT